MPLIDDPDAPDTGLPSDNGIDDIPLIVQDRSFSRSGELRYDDDGMAPMQGFRGDRILVNGVLQPCASVPAGLVRLRLLKGSNSRIYRFRFEDGRAFHQVASDTGLLPALLLRAETQLAPAGRAEIITDFADGQPAWLVSEDGCYDADEGRRYDRREAIGCDVWQQAGSRNQRQDLYHGPA